MTRLLSAAAVVISLAAQAQSPKLSIGDPAPALSVESWLKGTPVKSFEKGNTYIVEFWATWCGPCKATIPHLTEVQKKYQDQKVRVIGVDVWEKYADGTQGKVEAFIKEFGPKMDYTVAYDGKTGATAKAYMTAAGQNGIPTAFIVDRDGKIAYIGHPMGMDKALEEILKGGYSLEKAKADYEQREAEQKKMMEAQQKMMGPMNAFMGALKKKDYDKAYETGRGILAGELKDNPMALNAIAWAIVDPEALPEKKDLDLALKAATRANEVTGNKDAAILDTLARVHFLRGEKAKAIEIQKRAIDASPADQAAELKATLKQYEGAK